jgi:hypothetical protein
LCNVPPRAEWLATFTAATLPSQPASLLNFKQLSMKKFYLLFFSFLLFTGSVVHSQCTNTLGFGSVSILPGGTVSLISTCKILFFTCVMLLPGLGGLLLLLRQLCHHNRLPF